MAIPLSIEQVNHVARPTKRLEECRRFLDGCDGGTGDHAAGVFIWRGLSFPGDIQIHLIEYGAAPDPPESINTRERHMAFAVADVDAMELALREHGVVYKRSLIPDRGVHQIFFGGPDGHLMEIGKYGVIDV